MTVTICQARAMASSTRLKYRIVKCTSEEHAAFDLLIFTSKCISEFIT